MVCSEYTTCLVVKARPPTPNKVLTMGNMVVDCGLCNRLNTVNMPETNKLLELYWDTVPEKRTDSDAAIQLCLFTNAATAFVKDQEPWQVQHEDGDEDYARRP